LWIWISFLHNLILDFFCNPYPDKDPGKKDIFSEAITKFWEKFCFFNQIKVGILRNRELSYGIIFKNSENHEKLAERVDFYRSISLAG